MPKARHEISVATRVVFIPDQSDAERGRYVFAYTITITNTAATLAEQSRAERMKNAEQAMRAYESRFELMADAAPVLIWMSARGRFSASDLSRF